MTARRHPALRAVVRSSSFFCISLRCRYYVASQSLLGGFDGLSRNNQLGSFGVRSITTKSFEQDATGDPHILLIKVIPELSIIWRTACPMYRLIMSSFTSSPPAPQHFLRNISWCRHKCFFICMIRGVVPVYRVPSGYRAGTFLLKSFSSVSVTPTTIWGVNASMSAEQPKFDEARDGSPLAPRGNLRYIKAENDEMMGSVRTVRAILAGGWPHKQERMFRCQGRVHWPASQLR